MATLALDYTIISNPVDGVDRTKASKINNNGEVVGCYEDPATGYLHGFYLHNGEFVDIAGPGANQTQVFGVNDDGQLVGITFDDVTSLPDTFLYSAGSFSDFPVPGSDFAIGQDINNSGQVVGFYRDMGQVRGFIQVGGDTWQIIIDDAFEVFAFGVNDQGQIVGTYQTPDGAHGYVLDFFNTWTPAVLDVPGATSTSVKDINNWGQIAGHYVDNNGKGHGFVYAQGNFYTIDAPVGVGAVPGAIEVTGINNLGQVVGAYNTNGGGTESFTATLGMEFTYNVSTFDHPDAAPSGGSPAPASFGTEIRNSNVDGDFVGRYSDSPGPGFTGQSFASIGGSVFDLEFVDATGGIGATDINDLGQIAGFYVVAEDSSFHGFIYDEGDYQTLDSTLGDAGTTELLGMNNIGEIVGTYSDGGVEHAFLYDGADFTELDLSGEVTFAHDIIALDINDFGVIVGTYVGLGDGLRHGFMLKDGVFQTIASPEASVNGFGSGAVSINNAGQIAGFYMDDSFAVHAFVYSGGIYSTVDMPNPGGAYGISNNGTVAGSDNDGTTHHGFLAEISGGTLVPILAPSAPVVWSAAVDGQFNDGTKWAGGTTPGPLDKAVISRPGEFTVTMMHDATVNQLVVGSLDHDGARLQLIGSTLQVNGGRIVAPGTIALDGGAEILIDRDTVMIGGGGSDAEIQLGLVDGSSVSSIGTSNGPAKLVNNAFIAGQGQIGDADLTLVNGAGGNIEAVGGTLVLDTGTNLIVNSGNLYSGPGSTLDVDSAIGNHGEIVAFGPPSGGGPISGLAAPAGGTINLNGEVRNFDILSAEEGGSVNVTGVLKNFGLVDVSGSFSASGPVFNFSYGIQTGGNGVIDITGPVVNKGGIAAVGDSTVWLHGTVNNAFGELIARDGGTLIVGSTVGARGSASIEDDGSMHFQGAVLSSVLFHGDEGQGGKLVLDDASTFKGFIEGFDDTDMIQFKDLLFGSDVHFKYDEARTLLKVFQNGILDSKLSFVGSYTDTDFQIVDDGTGHIAIQHFEPLIG